MHRVGSVELLKEKKKKKSTEVSNVHALISPVQKIDFDTWIRTACAYIDFFFFSKSLYFTYN